MKRNLSFLVTISCLFFLWLSIPFSSAGIFSFPKKTTVPAESTQRSPFSKTDALSTPPASGRLLPPPGPPGTITSGVVIQQDPDLSQNGCEGKKTLGGFPTSIGLLKNVSNDQIIAAGSMFWIALLDSQKNFLWHSCFSGSAPQGGPLGPISDVVETSEGDFFTVGDNGPSNQQVRIIQFDHQGKFQWQRIYGNPDNPSLLATSFKSLVGTSDGGYVAAGSLNKHGLLVKLSADGSVEWQKTYRFGTVGKGRELSFQRILKTNDGNFFVAAHAGINDKQDAWFGLFDSEGNPLWQKLFGKQSLNTVNAVRSDQEGNFTIGGWRRKNVAAAQSWILKLDRDGKVLWQKTVAKGFNMITNFTEGLDDKGLVFFGTGSLSGNPREPNIFWASQLDYKGTVLWQKTYQAYIGLSIFLVPSSGKYLIGTGNQFFFVDTKGNVLDPPSEWKFKPITFSLPLTNLTQEVVTTDIQNDDIPLTEMQPHVIKIKLMTPPGSGRPANH